MSNRRAPVTDWLTDWDHLDPHWVNDPFPIWDAIREVQVPHRPHRAFKGAYLPTRYDDIRAIAYDPEHFSSRQVVVRGTRSLSRVAARRPSPPTRRATAPHAWCCCPPSRRRPSTSWWPKARAVCNELIDAFIAKGRCDAALEYTQHIPVRVIAHMLGIPDSDGDQFRKWIHDILEEGTSDHYVLERGFAELTEYFRGPPSGPPYQSWRRSHQLHADGQSIPTGRPSRRTISSAPCGCSWWPALTPPGAALALRSGTSPRPGRPGPAGEGAGADPDRHRGIPARLCSGHHGTPCRQGDHR